MRFVLGVLLALGVASAQGVFEAARSGSVDEVVGALAAGGDVAAVDESGDTPLLVAVRWNGADVVAALLDAGADPAYVNPKSGLGIFGLVWRNPDGAPIRALFAERGFVARAVVMPSADTPLPAAEAPPAEAPATAPGQPPADRAAAPGAEPEVPEPEAEDAAETEPYRPPLSLEQAASLGFAVDERDGTTRDDVEFFVVDVSELRLPLVPQAFALACRAAVLQLVRSPETAIFGVEESVGYNGEGIMRHETQMLMRNSAGVTVRFDVVCSGYLERGSLHIAAEIAPR
jgi:hypothetical protein